MSGTRYAMHKPILAMGGHVSHSVCHTWSHSIVSLVVIKLKPCTGYLTRTNISSAQCTEFHRSAANDDRNTLFSHQRRQGHKWNLKFWNFFSPVFLGWWGHVFGSESFEKFWPHMGFPPEIFFQKLSFFSNKSHRWCLVVRLSAERSVYINV